MSETYAKAWLATALFLWIAIALSPVGHLLETSMYSHVLFEIPLLVIIGTILGAVSINSTFCSGLLGLANRGGIAGILIATFVLGFWMIPRWLDASLTNDAVNIVKYLTLPLGVGLPLAWSWHRLHPIARGVVKIEFLSMLYRLGWLYLISPNRLCNSYLLNDQELLGKGFLVIAVSLSITWLIPVFFSINGNPEYAEAKASSRQSITPASGAHGSDFVLHDS